MKAIETTATIDETGRLTLDRSFDIHKPQRVRVIVLMAEDEEPDIESDQSDPDLTESQKREIDRRIDDSEMNPDNTLTWNEVKASIKGR